MVSGCVVGKCPCLQDEIQLKDTAGGFLNYPTQRRMNGKVAMNKLGLFFYKNHG